MPRTPITLLAVLITVATLGPVAGAAKSGATLVATEGQVQSRLLRQTQWQPAALRQLFAPGDALRTGRNARAELAYADGTVTRLAPHSLLRLPEPRQQQTFGRLLLGRLWFKVTKQHAPIRIETPAAVASVVGTELLVAVDSQQGTHVTCIEGHVKVKGDVGPEVALAAGQWTDIRKGEAAAAPTPFDWNRLKASEVLLQPLKQDTGLAVAEGDPDDIWK